jgi:RND family efflux transporter MFP subunit
MLRRSTFALACLFGALATFAGDAKDQPSSNDDMEELDCVIEPKLVLKLGAPDTGIVRTVNVDRDEIVKKGDVVARLDSELQESAVEIARAKASNENDIASERTRLGYRTTEAEHAISLQARGNGTAKARDEAVTEQQLAGFALRKAELEHRMAVLELAQAQAHLDRRTIHSPVNGVVTDVTIKPGEYAFDQAPLMTIAEIDPLYVKVFVPVRYYRAVQVGTVGEVRPEEPIGGLYRAKVTVVDRVFDAASSTFGVRLELPNPDYSLPAGMRCRVHFLAQGS